MKKGNTPEVAGNNYSQSRTNLRSQTTQKITSLMGKMRQLSAGNLIGQHGGSGRLSKFDRKTSQTEMRRSLLLSHVYDDLLLSVATTAV